MRDAFPDAEVRGYQDLIDSMTCHKKDRHVLAAVVRANVEVIVTFNLQDFPTTRSSATTSARCTPTRSSSTSSTSHPLAPWRRPRSR
jgi:hypothetical protein